MNACETVFAIQDLRFLILSFALDKTKKIKIKKSFIERRFPKILKLYILSLDCIDDITFKIFLFIYYKILLS